MRLRTNPATLRPIAIAFAAFSFTAAALAAAAPGLAAGDDRPRIVHAPGPMPAPRPFQAPDADMPAAAPPPAAPLPPPLSPAEQARADASAFGAADLKPGRYLWRSDVDAFGPARVIVDISDQRAYLYRGGTLVAISSVSTGRPGHRTPTGTFPITEKDAVHFSNKYDNAPMPHMQRLTNGGIALHAGRIPGHPASHGCIRLPAEFAAKLFKVTAIGTPVVIAA